MNDAQAAAEGCWYYEENGQRKGPVTESEMISFIKSSTVYRGTPVWKQGFPDWKKIENTDLRTHLDSTTPPPLSGEHISNTIVWILAFAPLIGYFIEWFVAGVIYSENQFAAEIAMANGKYWFITLALNIILSLADEKHLKNAGHNTEKFKGWVWLVPVYLYQRAQATKQSLAYFITWIVCFILICLG
ncbi:DUF4339 domain-containing protein [Vogesella mureinivorans]|uniref:DUF4339 domain-containing protein n=1 Tax=Vogesella mureinivorans TaxID=657276 RepID=UPI0011C8B829|nr:DUF4339 domain-containing protein [Vogesella mureinivorans]